MSLKYAPDLTPLSYYNNKVSDFLPIPAWGSCMFVEHQRLFSPTFILTVIQEAVRTKSLPKLRAAVALMKTNKMTDKLPQEAALAEDMLAEMEKIDDMKVSCDSILQFW